jgi:nucleoside-diphosphate-sugar epimerase
MQALVPNERREPKTMKTLPDSINTAAELDEILSRPSEATVECVKALDGDILVIGAGGKIGPSLCRMAKRAVDAGGAGKQVYAVDVLPMPQLAAQGIRTIQCDLLDLDAVKKLPQSPNVIFMVGRKFGSTGGEHLTWAINVIAPSHVARTFIHSRVAAFSTGCVYPVTHVFSGGSTENDPPEPVGEYAMSCLGRERMFDYYSQTQGAKVAHIRLNYAVELRYGVLFDIASRIWQGQPIDITTGFANVIWQGDLCNDVIRSLPLASSPARACNITGPEIFSIRQVAQHFGRLLGKDVAFVGEENGRAYLNNAGQCLALFGYPSVPLGRIVEWTASWVKRGGESLGKPTHFETQDGKY